MLNFVRNKYDFRDSKGSKLELDFQLNGGTAIVDFSLNGEQIYYYIVPKASLETKEDLDIVEEAVEALKKDHQRWLEQNTKVLRKTYDSFELKERTSLYHATLNEADEEHLVIVGIIEDNNKNFILTLKDNNTGSSMRTSLKAGSKEEVIDILNTLLDIVFQLLTPFQNDENQVRVSYFDKYILGE